MLPDRDVRHRLQVAGAITPPFFTLVPVVARHERIESARALETARLLQAAVPTLGTFTVPFCIGPDPDKESSFLALGRFIVFNKAHMSCPMPF